MKHRVVFHPRADRALIDLWMISQRRAEVTQAVDRLVNQLAAHPDDVGESREQDDRIAFEGPIGIEFKIDYQAREVLIYNIWEIKRRGASHG